MKDTKKKQGPVRRRVIINEEKNTASLSEQREKKKAEDKQRFLAILDEHLGIISYAAQQAGIPRRTIYEWMDSDLDFQRKVKEIDHKQLDFVERKLLENVKNNDTRAITFYLSTKGRGRGYSTRVEVTSPSEQPLRTEVAIVSDAREEMSNNALGKALKAAMQAFPSAFTDASRIAVNGKNIDVK